MIHVTKLNNEECIVNCDLIELLEITPDTLLTLTTGRKLMVRETCDEIVELIIAYREKSGLILAHPGMLASGSRKKSDDEDDEEEEEPPKGGLLRFGTR
jgi:flagellar protein FlbD